MDNLASISQAERTAVRGVKTPSASLKINLEVICLLKNIKPGNGLLINYLGEGGGYPWNYAKAER